MINDFANLEKFYNESLGQTVKCLLSIQLKKYWKDTRGKKILGIGFANPLLDELDKDADRIISLMPFKQGRSHWRGRKGNLSISAKEYNLPFPDNFFDRVIILHGLESCSHERDFLREVWRILEDEGKVLIITPKPLSFWVFSRCSPFYKSRVYSASKLKYILNNVLFVTLRHTSVLFAPPFRNSKFLNFIKKNEKNGTKFFPFLCGLNFMEAQKQRYIVGSHGSKLGLIKKSFIPHKSERQLKG